MAQSTWPTKLSKADVNSFLLNHPEFLETYLNVLVPYSFKRNILDKLKREAVRKKTAQKECQTSGKSSNIFAKIVQKCRWSGPFKRKSVPKQSKGCSTFFTECGIQGNARRIFDCKIDEEINLEIFKLGEVLSRAIKADAFRMYTVEHASETMYTICPEYPPKPLGPVMTLLTVAAFTAGTQETINICHTEIDDRFPNGIGDNAIKAYHVLCMPLIFDSGRVYGVFEFVKTKEVGNFTPEQVLLTNGVLKWVTESLQYANKLKMYKQQTTINDQLLHYTMELFDDVSSQERVLNNILVSTKDLVMAERCSLFLLDKTKQELVAERFDEGSKDNDGQTMLRKSSINIRLPNKTGIVGSVASTGKITNVKNVHTDDRFYPAVDNVTGYKTQHVLCSPIRSDRTGTLAVLEMINRVNGKPFSVENEETVEIYSVFCALAMHYAKLQSKLRDEHTKSKTAMAHLQNQMTCGMEEVEQLLANPRVREDQVPTRMYTLDFFCYSYTDILPQLFIRMIEEMFPATFDVNRLCRFILTVRRNYRGIPYHNFYHGFHVAHSVWQMLRQCQICVDTFTMLEKIGLVIGAVCHDLDHRAVTNDYLHKVQHPLAALYSTSTLEHHHYHLAVTILHSEGNDIFGFMSADEYRTVLEHIRNNILATDLCQYFVNKAYLDKVIEDGAFSVDDRGNRQGLLSLMMTGADICNATKTWDTFTDLEQEYDGAEIMKRTIMNIYDEFYYQGDKEKAKGLQPQPMMDRLNVSEIPKQQVGFIDFIAKPLYTTLSSLLPETECMLRGVKRSRRMWASIQALKEGQTFEKILDVMDKL